MVRKQDDAIFFRYLIYLEQIKNSVENTILYKIILLQVGIYNMQAYRITSDCDRNRTT